MKLEKNTDGASSQLPRVLILLATYNGAKWLETQLTSILNQTGVAISVLVSDDCSSDETRDIVSSYRSSSNSVTLLPTEGRFGSAGLNFYSLIRRCNVSAYDYVGYADQDDVWDETRLAEAIRQILSSQSGGYSCATRATFRNGKTKVLRQYPYTRTFDHLLEGAGQGCTFLLTSSLFLKVQATVIKHESLVHQIYFHDWLTYAISRTFGETWFFDQEARISYRQHESNEMGARVGTLAIKARMSRISSGWYLSQVRLITLICSQIAPHDAQLQKFLDLLQLKNSSQKVRLILELLLHGRRRLSERILISAMVALGKAGK